MGLTSSAANPPSGRSPHMGDLCPMQELDAGGPLCGCPTQCVWVRFLV